MSASQRGVALLITVLLIIAVAGFGALVAGSISSSDITASSRQGDAVEALYAAETGLERALKRFNDGTACASLGEGPVNVTAGRTFTVTAFTTGFSSASLTSTQCRVQSVGSVSSSGVTRTVQVIMDKSLVGGPAVNAGFNNPPNTSGTPSGWTGAVFDYTGGPDARTGTGVPNCTRSAYTVKADTGGSAANGSTAGNLNPNFTVPAGTVITVTFDYRVVRIRKGDNACTPTTGTDCTSVTTKDTTNSPAPGGSQGDAQICFSITDTASVTSWSKYLAVNTGLDLRGDPEFSVTGTFPCTPTTQQSGSSFYYTSCSAGYQTGYPTSKGTLTITVGGTGSRTVNNIGFNLNFKSGNAGEVYMDNLVYTVPAGTSVSGATTVTEWRDCSVTSCA
ncbi:MAG: hypothetical protein ACT4P4_04810 [Betaproteobacteria bacterium]